MTSGEFVKLDSKAHALWTKKTIYRSVIKKSMVDSDHANFWFIFLTIIRTCGNKVRAGDFCFCVICPVMYTYIKNVCMFVLVCV